MLTIRKMEEPSQHTIPKLWAQDSMPSQQTYTTYPGNLVTKSNELLESRANEEENETAILGGWARDAERK